MRMSRFGRLVTVLGIGLLTAVGVTGVLAGPGGVLRGQSDGSPPAAESADVVAPNQPVAAPVSSTGDGEELKIVGDVIICAVGEDTRFKFEEEGDEFEVTGVLDSLDATTVVVLGPGVMVDAAIETDIRVKLSDQQPGHPVRVRGTLTADDGRLALEIKSACDELAPAGVCERGPGEAGDLRLEIDDGEVDIERGAVLSFADGVLAVDTGIGPLTVMMDAGTEVDGDLSLAVEVRVEGTLTDGDTVLADKVKALCPDAAHDADADDDRDVDDDPDDDEDDRGDGHRDDDRHGHHDDHDDDD